MPPPRERIVNSLNSVRRRGRKVEIAESLYGEKMTVEANDRNRFQLVYLWAPRMSKKVSPGIPKEHPIPPNHAEVYPKVPDGEELVAGNGTKLFIEVGIMIGSDPESFFTAAGESEKHRSVLGQAISPTPTSRHRDALRVFMPVHDSMAKQSSFYAGYGPGNGRLTPHRIRCQGVFFYSELWKGVKRRSNFGQRRRGLLKACRRHATVAVSASEKALSATTTSFDHNALPKDAKVEPSRTLSKVHNPRTKAAEVVDLTTLDEAESVPSTHSNFDSSDVNLSVSTRPRRLVNDSADATHQPDTSGSDGPWIPRKKRRVSTKTSPATKVATRGHALEDSPSRSADPGSSTKKTDSVKRIQDVRVGATNEGIDAFMTFDKELTLELAIRAAEELKHLIPNLLSLNPKVLIAVHDVLRHAVSHNQRGTSIPQSFPANGLGFFLDLCHDLDSEQALCNAEWLAEEVRRAIRATCIHLRLTAPPWFGHRLSGFRDSGSRVPGLVD